MSGELTELAGGNRLRQSCGPGFSVRASPSLGQPRVSVMQSCPVEGSLMTGLPRMDYHDPRERKDSAVAEKP